MRFGTIQVGIRLSPRFSLIIADVPDDPEGSLCLEVITYLGLNPFHGLLHS